MFLKKRISAQSLSLESIQYVYNTSSHDPLLCRGCLEGEKAKMAECRPSITVDR